MYRWGDFDQSESYTLYVRQLIYLAKTYWDMVQDRLFYNKTSVGEELSLQHVGQIMNGNVIVLNGTSSSGKTTLARELQSQCTEV